MWIENREVLVNGKLENRYCFVERYKSTLTGKYRKVSVTYGKKTPQVVKAATQELERKINKALAEESEFVQTATLSQVSTAFLEQYQKRVQPSTYKNGALFIKKFVDDFGHDTIISNISQRSLNRYFNDMLYNNERDLTNGTVRAIKNKVSVLFDFAVTYGYLKDNNIKKVKIEWKNENARKRNQIENKYLTQDEYRKIIDDCLINGADHYADVFKLQYLTGMRFGEASGLRVQDVIKENGKTYLDINHSLVFLSSPSRYYLSDSTKTFAGMRKIILSPEATKIVERHMHNKDLDALLFAYNPSAPHFADQKPLNINNANTMLKRIIERQKIDKDVTTHYFRHTHVSVLADMDVPLRVIKDRIGHADTNITEKIYMHVTKKARQDFEAKIAQIDNFL